MAQIIYIQGDNGQVQYRQNIFRAGLDYFYTLDKFTRSFIIVGILIVLSAPLVANFLVFKNNLPISKVKINKIVVNPKVLNLKADKSPVRINILAFDSKNKQINNGVFYKWETNISNAVGKLIPGTASAEFIPLSSGSGTVNIIAICSENNDPIVESIQVNVLEE
jgi:hypothetical protein